MRSACLLSAGLCYLSTRGRVARGRLRAGEYTEQAGHIVAATLRGAGHLLSPQSSVLSASVLSAQSSGNVSAMSRRAFSLSLRGKSTSILTIRSPCSEG